MKLLTSCLGSLLGPSSAALHNIQSRFWKAISVSVTIEERDEIYQAVEDFLTDLSKECKINNLIATKNMTSNPPKASNSLMTTSTSNVQYAPGKFIYRASQSYLKKKKMKVDILNLSSGYGQHEIYYKGKKIRVRKERQATQLQNQTHQIPAVATSQGSKIINLWTLSRNSFCLQELIDEAMQSFRNKNSGKVSCNVETEARNICKDSIRNLDPGLPLLQSLQSVVCNLFEKCS